jgi:Domain of unknown function (DUF4166)
MSESTPLYRKVLGSRFDSLPAVLRRFHDSPHGGRARGTLDVERGPGRIRNVVAALWRLPRSGSNVPVFLEVLVDGEKERWLRHFPDHCLKSTQWTREGLLIEAFGAGSFSCALVIDGLCLRYEFRRAWLLGIPIPGWLTPRVDGRVRAGDTGWRVVVRFRVPLLGEIVHYEGWVEPE